MNPVYLLLIVAVFAAAILSISDACIPRTDDNRRGDIAR